jgi:hypothetical protein
MDDVAGQPSESKRELATEVQDGAADDAHQTEDQQRASELLVGVHGEIVARLGEEEIKEREERCRGIGRASIGRWSGLPVKVEDWQNAPQLQRACHLQRFPARYADDGNHYADLLALVKGAAKASAS